MIVSNSDAINSYAETHRFDYWEKRDIADYVTNNKRIHLRRTVL